jgi:hypothetical protein
MRTFLHMRLHWLFILLLAGLMSGCTQSGTKEVQSTPPEQNLLPDTEQPIFVLFYTDN